MLGIIYFLYLCNEKSCLTSILTYNAEIRTVAKSLPLMRWGTHNSLIFSYPAVFSVILVKKDDLLSFRSGTKTNSLCQRIIRNTFSAIATRTTQKRHSGEKLLPSLWSNSASTYVQPSGLVIALKVFCKMDDSARRQGHVLVRQHIAWRRCSGILVPFLGRRINVRMSQCYKPMDGFQVVVIPWRSVFVLGSAIPSRSLEGET